MLKLVLLSLAALTDAAKFDDSRLTDGEPQAFHSKQFLGIANKNERFGDYRIAASAQAGAAAAAAALPVANVDVNTLRTCKDCEYLISSLSQTQTMCLTSAGDGTGRCSLWEDKLGFKVKPVLGPGDRLYFQIVNTMDNMCLQDVPAKIHTNNMMVKTLASTIPRLLISYHPDSPEVQEVVTALWRQKIIRRAHKRVYGACAPPTLKSLFSHQLWQLEKVAYGTKQFLLRNMRTNRCLFLDAQNQLGLNSLVGVSDCTNPDSSTGGEGLMQSLQALVIQPRPPAVNLKQGDGNARCLQLVGGRAVLSDCVPATTTSKAILSGGKHDGKAIDFVPVGGCVEQLVNNPKGGVEAKTMCSQLVQFYSPTAGSANPGKNASAANRDNPTADRNCLVVQRAMVKNDPVPILSLATEKCSLGGASADPNASPLERRGGFAAAETARRQTWWVEKIPASTGNSLNDKIALRWRFWDGTTACLFHNNLGEVKVQLCGTTKEEDGYDLTWGVEPIHIV